MTDKPQPTTVQRFANLLREAHRTARLTPPVLYPLMFVVTAGVLFPFFVAEPDSFDYPDHV